jgi:hypothetical protein|tara:strand:- start:960 stop:1133 length:174 start_codon:yes stop_codon:yes gene_type:complete
MLKKRGRVKMEEGGKPFDPTADWIKLIKLRSQLSPTELKVIDDLVIRMFDKEKNQDE